MEEKINLEDIDIQEFRDYYSNFKKENMDEDSEEIVANSYILKSLKLSKIDKDELEEQKQLLRNSILNDIAEIRKKIIINISTIETIVGILEKDKDMNEYDYKVNVYLISELEKENNEYHSSLEILESSLDTISFI